MEMLIANIFLVVAGIVFFAIPSAQYNKTFKQAMARLNAASADSPVADMVRGRQFEFGPRLHFMYYGAVIAFTLAALLVIGIITYAIEPGADLITEALLYGIYVGIGMICLVVSVGFAVVAAVRLKKLKRMIADVQAQLPESEEIRAMVDDFAWGNSRKIMHGAAIVGAIGAFAVGAITIVVLFMASTVAIECARSSKCL